MDKELLKYINKETNVLIQGNIKITRDTTPQGVENINVFVMDKGDELPLYNNIWYDPNKNKSDKKPKNTGGKKPYLMLMVSEIEALREKGVKKVEELIGYVVCLGNYIEWNSGRLIHKRSKKPIQYKDLQEIYKCGNNKLNKMIKLMKDNDLLYYTDEGYFISQKYIKKGKSQRKGSQND